MPHRHRLDGRPQPVGAGGAVERLEHHELGEFRQIFFHRVLDREAVLLDELHRGGRGDGLGHRRDAEQRVELQRPAGIDVGDAERATIDDALAVGRHDHHAGHVLALDRAAHRIVDGLGLLHRILLRVRGERPSRRAAEERHELASLHRFLLPSPAAAAGLVVIEAKRITAVGALLCRRAAPLDHARMADEPWDLPLGLGASPLEPRCG